MGLISRVSSRTYRKMLARQVPRALRVASVRASSSEQHVNEFGGWVCKDRADFEKWWPKQAEKQRLHAAQYQAHIPVHEQGKYGKLNSMFDSIFYHVSFVSCLVYGFMRLVLEV